MSRKIDHIVSRFSQPVVLVLGDIILDVYLNGSSTRVSPEAPVPVINISKQRCFIGGAANVAANLRSLGARVIFCSVCGKDPGSKKVIRQLDKMGISTENVLLDPTRHTIIKERIMSQSQIVARFDRGSENDISPETEAMLAADLAAIYPHCDALVIADYNKGILTPGIIATLQSLRRKKPVFLSVDSKDLRKFRLLEPSVVKPNYEETARLLGLQPPGEDRLEWVRAHAGKLAPLTGAGLHVVTLDADGAIAFPRDGEPYHCPARPVAHPHVIGAGDTFMSALTLSLVCSAHVPEAVDLACAAACISVTKENTACCTDVELRSFFVHQRKTVDSLQDLQEICSLYRKQGRTIVFTNGCFDILHSGHVNYLNRAGKLGDVMIVGVNNDESIQRLKGHNRPINPMKDRIEVLEALEVIDHIIAFGAPDDDTPIEVIKTVKPDVFVKGGDYTKDKLPEAAYVENFGGEVRFLPLIPDHSTTNVIRRIRAIPSRVRIARSS
jgi:D-beta-D-heptose 7-phosphate kinase/D-beta-D-heptose 1-phosphate adenosyltransferase